MGRKKKKTTVRDLAKKELRDAQNEQGHYDGRFNTRSVASDKDYKRNPKHKGRDPNEDE
jgi:hypothetical protein